jgi:hypothetical protein
MSIGMVVGLVLLPVLLYGLALLMAACRDWLGVTGAPRARNLVRAIRPPRRGTVERPRGRLGI